MLKKSNQGFALIPVIAIISVLSIGGYFSYNYFFNNSSDSLVLNNLSDKQENVLAATAQIDPDSYIFKNIFNVSNLAEFNKRPNPIFFKLRGDLKECIFLPRNSKPLIVNFKSLGKSYTATIYQNVTMHTLVSGAERDPYIVMTLSPDVTSFANEGVVRDSQLDLSWKTCQDKKLFYGLQPKTLITAKNYDKFFLVDGTPNPGGSIGDTSASINAIDKGTIMLVTVDLTSGTPQKNALITNKFRQAGVSITYNNNQKAVIRNISCVGNCQKFTVSLPGTSKTIKSIDFPVVNDKTVYSISFGGKEMRSYCDSNDSYFTNTIRFPVTSGCYLQN